MLALFKHSIFRGWECILRAHRFDPTSTKIIETYLPLKFYLMYKTICTVFLIFVKKTRYTLCNQRGKKLLIYPFFYSVIEAHKIPILKNLHQWSVTHGICVYVCLYAHAYPTDIYIGYEGRYLRLYINAVTRGHIQFGGSV